MKRHHLTQAVRSLEEAIGILDPYRFDDTEASELYAAFAELERLASEGEARLLAHLGTQDASPHRRQP
jgi:hypothetical protein